MESLYTSGIMSFGFVYYRGAEGNGPAVTKMRLASMKSNAHFQKPEGAR